MSAKCQQRTLDGASLIFGKSIQSSVLHYLESGIHCCSLIAGNLFRQEVAIHTTRVAPSSAKAWSDAL